MTNNSEIKSEATILRQQVEELLKYNPSITDRMSSKSETLKLAHELEVHQIELEMQHEELMRAKSEAQHIADKYMELYDFAPSGYFTLSPNGCIIEVNLCGSQLLGREQESLKNSQFIFFVSDDTKFVFSAFLERLFNSKIKESCEVILYTEDTPSKYVYLTGILTSNSAECLITMIDMTEWKMTEKAMIENQRLSAIGEMASSIAHDFNNSLQLISGNLELAMLHSKEPENTIGYLETISNVVKDTAGRIMLLQRFGDNKETKSHFSMVDLNLLIDEVIVQTQPFWKDEAEKKGLLISVNTKYGMIPELLGNAEELRTVMFNLIKNSIDAMPMGGEIMICTGKKDDRIHMTIKDSGMGMDEETRIRIFQPFYSTKGFEIGRGLGMCGAMGIIKEHAGTICIKETGIKGTIVEIMFPLRPDEKTILAKGFEEKELTSDKNVRMLWVEDDEAINEIAAEMIRILGYNGDTVRSGKEALEYFKQNDYDLVITDIGMPEMNGWEFIDILRTTYKSNCKIAVVSGWDYMLNADELAQQGINYYFNKPFGIKQLKGLLEEVEVAKK
jgi:two-component system, cell cycle sensor histidine kinase and response regulator CckA